MDGQRAPARRPGTEGRPRLAPPGPAAGGAAARSAARGPYSADFRLVAMSIFFMRKCAITLTSAENRAVSSDAQR